MDKCLLLIGKRLASVSTASGKGTAVYVSSLPWITGKGQLINHFRQFGPVANVYLPYNEKSGFSRGFAVVRLKSSEDVDKVLREDHEIDGRKSLTFVEQVNPLHYSEEQAIYC